MARARSIRNTREATPRRRRRWIAGTAAGAVVAVAATLAAVWPGYDAQQTPLDDGTVWALQTGAGSGYARVNLELGEVDTVKHVDNGSTLVQSDRTLLVFADSDSRYATVSMATPLDLTDELEDVFTPSPGGTRDVVTAGDTMVLRTETGEVYAAPISSGGSLIQIDPFADVEVADGDERPRFVATAVTVDEGGTVYAYSADAGAVLRARASTGAVLGQDEAPEEIAGAQIAAVGGTWLVLDPASGETYVKGRDEPIVTATTEAVLQQSSLSGDGVLLADAQGLVRVDPAAGTAERVVSGVFGAPAAPAALGGEVYAAWLPESSADAGALWSTAQPELIPLDYAGVEIGDEVEPVFVGNGTRLALNEQRSGWVWTVPDGRLVTTSQQWNLDERSDQQQEEDVDADRVLDPKPPVAVGDAFGVRAGTIVALPVLLNDHDPNEDVLTIDPASVTGLDPAFGTVSVTGDEQALAVAVAPGARGSATLQYRITDGTSSDGLYSETATVTLSVVPEADNSAPVWCGVVDCLATWPAPQVAPGGTVTVDVLSGWVDPEGDAVYLAGAVISAGAGTVAADPGGRITYQHPDPNASDASPVQIMLTVSDSRGASVEQLLTIQLTASPALAVEPLATVGVVGEQLEIPMLPQVSGVTGRVSISSAVTTDESRARVSIRPASTSLLFTATEAGSYLVQVAVRDEAGERQGVVRVTVRDRAQAAVSTAPLTAFVRPGEDATIDVLPAASNPAGHVLLVGNVVQTTEPDATLTVDLVGQSMLRVSGATDSGRSGTLGVVHYTISDGTDDPLARAEGELTVILLPSPAGSAPIAVDDRVTVRAGAQIDIPVLDNDVASSGALIGLDPSKVVNETGAGLVFAAGDVLRYLAPDEPGVYTVGYTVYRLGFPEAVDTARVIITVVGSDANQPPVPPLLTGRVIAGSSVRIPLDAVGIDPDGDAVSLDRIVTQPESGSATIAPEGDAIVYTSAEGFSGQVSFQYQVRDTRRATGVGEVRVGVIDAQANPSPVTYSDYVQVQVGADSEVVLTPAENDIDPEGGDLELVEVRPNAQEGTPEHAALTAMLGTVDDGRVVLRAGEELGTFSFVYTVRNPTGDTAMGLIVVKVVRDAVPDYPIVSDTILTMETRESFPTGVDVLAGKVSWTGGDVAGLTLALWEPPAGVTSNGWTISGDIPVDTLLIPFEVTGTAFDGTPVSSFGFLRVLGDNDIRLSLAVGTRPLEVKEGESVELDLASVVPIPRGQTLQAGDGVTTSGARAEAVCTLVSGTTIRYSAGAGAPWSDSCIVPLRLGTQEEYTPIVVRVVIEAEIPQPILRSASITVSPGATETYDLVQMVGWAGKEDWPSLQYATSHSGEQFTVTQNGALLTVTGNDASRPGREDTVAVTLPSHPDTRGSTLILTVGPAPSTLPKGGSVAQACSQSGGTTSCLIPVIGKGGEVNPLPGTPLRLVAVSGPAGCTGVTFTVGNETAVQASWTADAPGAAECVGSFVVEDAQGRQSSGDRDGQVILDLQGLPANPARLEWTAYTDTTVTMRVIADTPSHPSIDGFRLYADGAEIATCSADGLCPAVTQSMEKPRMYEARAFSSVGTSRSATSSVKAWSYRTPAAPTASAFVPVPQGAEGGRASITLSGIDPSTASVRVDGGAEGARTIDTHGATEVTFEYQVGSNQPTTLTATPQSQYALPPVEGSGSTVGASLSFTAHGLGAPRAQLTLNHSSSGNPGWVRGTLTAEPDGVYPGMVVLAGIQLGDTCSPVTVVDDPWTLTEQFDGIETFDTVTVTGCAEVSLGGQVFGSASAQGQDFPTENIPEPVGDLTYTVPLGYSVSGSEYTWNGTITGPNVTSATFKYQVNYRVGSTKTKNFTSLFTRGAHPGTIELALCHRVFTDRCSTWVTVTPTGAAYQPTVTFPGWCKSPGEPDAVNVGARAADYTLTRTSATDPDTGVVTYTFNVVWQGALSGLDPIVDHTLVCEAPDPEPEPDPDPEPDPEPEPEPDPEPEPTEPTEP